MRTPPVRNLDELDAELGRGARRLLGQYRTVLEEMNAAFRRYDATTGSGDRERAGRVIERCQDKAARLHGRLYRMGVTEREMLAHARTRVDRRAGGGGAR